MYPYISNFLNPYQENNFKALLDVLSVHGARIAEETIKEFEKVEQLRTANNVFVSVIRIKESFLEKLISIGKIGDCVVINQPSSSSSSPYDHYRFNFNTSNHHGYHVPSDIAKYAMATNIFAYGVPINMPVIKTTGYAANDALGYLFNSYYMDLKNLFVYCDWKNFNFREFYIKVEKFIEAAFKTSENIGKNALNSMSIVDFMADFIRSSAQHQHKIKINGVNMDTYYSDGVYQFSFNYKDIKSDQMRGITKMLKDNGYRVKSASFMPIKLILIREPKSFNGNKPEYK